MTNELSAAFLIQTWFNKGSDFAREDITKGNRLYYGLRFNYELSQLGPYAFGLGYMTDANVEDRSISMVTFDFSYSL